MVLLHIPEHSRNWEVFTSTVQFMNYGKFEEYDEYNAYIGEFSANEVALGIGWGRELTPHFQ